jgi:hypothetical protein
MSTRKSSRVLQDVAGNGSRVSKKAKVVKAGVTEEKSVVNPYAKAYVKKMQGTRGSPKPADDDNVDDRVNSDVDSTRTADEVSTQKHPSSGKPPPIANTVYTTYFENTGEIIAKGCLEEVEYDISEMPSKIRSLSGATVKIFASMKDFQDFRLKLLNREATEKTAGRVTVQPVDVGAGASSGGTDEMEEFDIARVNLRVKPAKCDVGGNKMKAVEIIEVDVDDVPDIIKNVDSPSTPLKSADSVASDTSTGSPEIALLNISPAAKSFSKYLKTRGMKCYLHYWPSTPLSAVAQVM